MLTTAERLWTKVDKDGPTMPHMGTPCWVWTGFRDKDGYGIVTSRPLLAMVGYRKAHRAIWAEAFGPIEAGQLVCHRCDNPGCVRPDHLFTGTHLDNHRDRDAKDRGARGDKNGSRLHPERLVRGDAHPIRQHPELRRGERNGRAKLTAVQAATVRDSHEPTKALAERYGVCATTIQRIRSGRGWRTGQQVPA